MTMKDQKVADVLWLLDFGVISRATADHLLKVIAIEEGRGK